jgi:membrane protein
VGGGRLAAAVKRAVAPVKRYGRAVWSRDRAALGGWRSPATRIARVVIWSVRGLFVHRLSLQAAALAYYTLFSIVPVLVVALWVLKLFHLIPYLKPDEPDLAAASAAVPHGHPASAGDFLRQAVRAILASVERAGRLETGIVGLAALLFGVIKQVMHVEQALDTIAGARGRPPKYWRMLGYLALLALPPALLIVSGLVRLMSRLPLGAEIARALSWLMAALPLLKSAIGVGIGLGIICLALALFYASAARARIPLSSTFVGGAVGAVMLAGVLWAFARLQIGASRVGALESGMAAVPVFLLWSFSSWLVILIGAQVAVAHELDAVLIHGASRLRLDPYDEQMAGVQIMVEATQRGLSLRDDRVTTNELARKLRLLPESVREVAARLAAAGLLREDAMGGYRIACDPDRTSLRDIVAAIIGRRPGDRAIAAARQGPTLHELVGKEAMPGAK